MTWEREACPAFSAVLARGAERVAAYRRAVGAWRPCTFRVATCLARMPDLARVSAVERASRGIGSVFRARISRSDQGGYGSFAPAEVA